MSIPIVSVCVASYNHARFLPEMLDAILGQTLRDFEIVVVDDGSTDNSMEVLQAYANRNPEIMRVYTHPGGRNLGISATVNLGFEKSRGKYWCPHDSDDISYLDRLARQVAFLENHPDVGWLYGIADFIDGNSRRLDGHQGEDASSCLDLIERLTWSNPIASPTTMIRRECMLLVGKWDETLVCSDWEYWIRLAARYPPVFLPGPVLQYRIHGSNSSVNMPKERELKYYLQCLAAVRKKADFVGGRINLPRFKALLEFQQAKALILLGDLESADHMLDAMFRTDPSLREDPKRLAQWLYLARDRRLSWATLRQLGMRSAWLADKDFMSSLLYVLVYCPLRAHVKTSPILPRSVMEMARAHYSRIARGALPQ